VTATARHRRPAIAVLELVGAISRRALGRGWVGWRTAGVTKRLIPRLVAGQTLDYRDTSGHIHEADLSDPIELAGFFGAHSPGLLRKLATLLSPGDWAIDVGANVGIVTSRMCALVGARGLVWSFEPLPRNVDKLEALKRRNRLDQLSVFPIALSASDATAILRLPASGGSAYGSFVAPWEAASEIEVPTDSLDHVVADLGHAGRRIGLLKIDAEGAEPQVLAGAFRVLKEMRPVVLCEFNDYLLQAAGTSSDALLSRFAEWGYVLGGQWGRKHRSLGGHTVDIVLTPVEGAP
jgi:FkbM family methyltransferase